MKNYSKLSAAALSVAMATQCGYVKSEERKSGVSDDEQHSEKGQNQYVSPEIEELFKMGIPLPIYLQVRSNFKVKDVKQIGTGTLIKQSGKYTLKEVDLTLESEKLRL